MTQMTRVQPRNHQIPIVLLKCSPYCFNYFTTNRTMNSHAGGVTRRASAWTEQSFFPLPLGDKVKSQRSNRKAGVQGHTLPDGIPPDRQGETWLCLTLFSHRAVRDTKSRILFLLFGVFLPVSSQLSQNPNQV